jgi:hypothetical protein
MEGDAMNPSDEANHEIHEHPDGTLSVVLETGPDWERRGRRAGDRVHIETWRRVESTDLSPESVATLHHLAEQRLSAASNR